MIRTVRRALRAGLLILWSALCIPVYDVGLLFTRREMHWRTRAAKAWSKGVAHILAMRIRVIGTPPEGAFLLVTNHLSYVDAILLLTQVRGFFIGREDTANWPLVKWVIRRSGTLFLNRDRRADVRRISDRMEDVLQQDSGLILHLEATTSLGEGVRPFKSGLLELAARQERPVETAVIRYSTPHGEAPAQESVCWFGPMPFKQHILGLLGLKYFEATLIFPGEPIVHSDRKVLARLLQTQVEDHFVPVYTPEEATATASQT